MNQQEFATAVMRTRTLVEEANGEQSIKAERQRATPTTPEHLSWMLSMALEFRARGSIAKANRWLGFVQGVLAKSGKVNLEALERANIPEGSVYDPERV